VGTIMAWRQLIAGSRIHHCRTSVVIHARHRRSSVTPAMRSAAPPIVSPNERGDEGEGDQAGPGEVAEQASATRYGKHVVPNLALVAIVALFPGSNS
jgi:hypothetical protein